MKYLTLIIFLLFFIGCGKFQEPRLITKKRKEYFPFSPNEKLVFVNNKDSLIFEAEEEFTSIEEIANYFQFSYDKREIRSIQAYLAGNNSENRRFYAKAEYGDCEGGLSELFELSFYWDSRRIEKLYIELDTEEYSPNCYLVMPILDTVIVKSKEFYNVYADNDLIYNLEYGIIAFKIDNEQWLNSIYF